MARPKLNLPYTGITSFGKFPILTDLSTFDADVGILGIPFDMTTQYRSGAKMGPRGVRDSSSIYSFGLGGSYDPERDDVYLGEPWRIVDCGDADMVHGDLQACFENTRDAVKEISDRGGMVVGIGGDHAVTIPILQGLADQGPFGIIQIDAHLDFVDQKAGQRFGHGSPMRRASEMDHVTGMAQLGIRGIGSSGRSDFDAARAYGSVIMSPKEIRAAGIAETLRRIPQCDQYYVTIDIDGIDPSIAWGTGTPSPGGLYYDEVNALLEGIAKKGKVIGFDLVEVAPCYDTSGLTGQVAARIILDLIGFALKERERAGDLPRR
ncbi:agmatinase [Rhodoligotrophos appendicifer]|uniref:agmatinase n=1 Tax=Rhodoligotrophos appendicifer TaxID=987056 RepID=UPI0011811087|nr:agmatinase [Rhodoligotrophos appendicifer]